MSGCAVFLLPLREKVAREGRMRGTLRLVLKGLVSPSSAGEAGTFSRKGRRGGAEVSA